MYLKFSFHNFFYTQTLWIHWMGRLQHCWCVMNLLMNKKSKVMEFNLCLMCLFLDLGQNMLVLSIICALSWINQIINKMNLVCIGLLAMSCWNLLCKWPYGTYLWSRGKLLVCRFTFVPKVSTLECLKDQVAHEVERINEEQGSGSRSTRNKLSCINYTSW